MQRSEKERRGDGSEPGQQTMLGVLLHVAKQKGVLAVFDGLGPELIRGMLSGALMLMAKERIDAVVFSALLK
jgi:hypothetical protein